MYYGTEYPYGSNTINSNGAWANVLVRFRWRASLDLWLDRKPPQGERIRIDSRHPYVRLAQRHADRWVPNDEGIDSYAVHD